MNGGGWQTGVDCPKCKSEVLYNGNYYCSSCSWVLGVRQDVRPYLQGLRDTAARDGDEKMAAICDYYLSSDVERW